MDDNLEQLLRNLKLKRIHEILDRELHTAQDMKPSYSELLAKLLREEYQHQLIRRLENRIKRAKLPERWVIETFPFKKQSGVNATAIRQLGELDFISRAVNIISIGQTGVGKTGLATGILMKAMEEGYRCLFIKAQELFDEMYTSLADRSTRKLLNRLINMDILLVDEMGYLNLRPEQSNIFFKLMEERYYRKQTIITTNRPYEEWYDFLGKKEMVDALLDRIRHKCITIKIDGLSLRTPEF